MIPFGDWLPDQPALANPGATIANNVIPRLKSYGQFRSLSAYTLALTGRCYGATKAITANGTVYNFAGDATKLYLLDDMTWANVSKGGNYSNVTSWEYARHGDRIVAANLLNPLQYFDMGTSALFADLPGTPPQAARVGVVRDFLVLGDIKSGSDFPARLAWSGYNNTNLWTASRATQSDVRDLRGDGGRIMQIVSGQTGVIFQESSIWMMRYAGPPTIFTLDEVERGRGTPAAKSVVRVGESIYYLGQDGFYKFSDGQSQPIGAERINRWFFTNCGELSSVIGMADIRNTLIYWSFSTSGGAAYGNKVVVYNWTSDKWSSADVNIEAFANQAAQSLTLDQLDSVLAGGIDATTFAVDSPAYQGGQEFLSAFDSSHKAAAFTGSPLVASLETAEFGDEPRSLLRHVRALVDGAGSLTVQHVGRNHQENNTTYGLPINGTDNGLFLIRKKSRYHRVKVNITGGFVDAMGIEPETRKAGGR